MATLNPTSPGAPAWYRQRWPWLLMLGPFIVVLAGSYTCWLAFSKQDALVAGDYYKQGKAINQDLRRDRAASKLGLGLALDYDAVHARLEGRVESRVGAAIGPLSLHLAHATLPQKDLSFAITPDAQGRFSVALPMLERSRWQVLAEGGQRSWRLEGSWAWPAQRSTTIVADPGA
ncbi:MAG: FixH family protein [Pseudomonadota bacterium]